MTSCEPTDKAPYHPNLKWRVAWLRIEMEYSYRSIASNLNVGLGTVYYTLKHFKTGDVAKVQ